MKQTVNGNIKCFDISCSDEDIEKSMNRKSILDTILEEKDKEIERLNNIINELEKYLEKHSKIDYECNATIIHEQMACAIVLNKLKELKENGNNE
jgi:hypothetical protein